MTEYNRREQARIAKLQVEVESLRGRIEAATVVMTDAATEIKRLKAEIERLKAIVKAHEADNVLRYQS